MFIEIKNKDKTDGLIKLQNQSIILNLLSMLILFLVLLVERNYQIKEIFSSYLSDYHNVNFLFDVILLLPMCLNYFLILKTFNQIKLKKLNKIIRHTLNIGFLLWLILATISESHITLDEIAIAFYLFFLMDLLFTLKLKNTLSEIDLTMDTKLFFMFGFILSLVILFFFYFSNNLSFYGVSIFFIFLGVYISLILMNIYFIFNVLFKSTKAKEI
jgi:hypothetical protein